MTAEEKSLFARNQAVMAAGEANLVTLQRETGLRVDAAFYADTYTKWGKMSTEEIEAYVQEELTRFDEGEVLNAKHQQEIEKSNASASPTGQSGTANPASSSVPKYFRYEESHEMYLSNVSTLSLDHAKTQLGIIELKIKNREDVGENIHGRYGNQEISDLNTYLAALKDYISKLEIGVSPASGEAKKGPFSTVG